MLVAVAWASKDDNFEWKEYKEKYHSNKIFDDEDKKFENFKKISLKVRKHNEDPDRSYDQELNEFSIYSEEEFADTYCKTRVPEEGEEDPVVDTIVKGVKRTTKATTTTKAATTTQAQSTTTTLAPVQNWPGPLGNYTRDTVPPFVNHTDLFQPIQDQKSCGSCWAFAAGSGIGKGSLVEYVANNG